MRVCARVCVCRGVCVHTLTQGIRLPKGHAYAGDTLMQERVYGVSVSLWQRKRHSYARDTLRQGTRLAGGR